MTPTRVMLSILFLLGPAVYAVVPPPITGDYVEVRSNHVYTCGCLYSGEQVTSGAEAILTWSIREGEFQGVPLSGLRVVAVVQGQGNLALPGVTRKSVLLIDSSASDSQRQALRRLFQEQY